MIRYLLLSAAAAALVACSQKEKTEETPPAPAAVEEAAPVEEAAAPTSEERLDAVLAAQSDETKARYQYRHPKETLMFFGVEPGMTVVDTLPGEPGWYTPILLSYLGLEGRVIGADYSMQMWPLFKPYVDDAFLEKRKTWTETYLSAAEALRSPDAAPVSAFVYGSAPDELNGTVDVVLMIRAAHHFNRLEDGRFFTEALGEIRDMLKPGGVLAVVQHRAPESASDTWANGDNGYLKQSRVVSVIEGAGFEFVGSSEVNANPKDAPTEEELVWRLPPTLATSADNPELRAQMEAIGESDRMTLKFKKPE